MPFRPSFPVFWIATQDWCLYGPDLCMRQLALPRGRGIDELVLMATMRRSWGVGTGDAGGDALGPVCQGRGFAQAKDRAGVCGPANAWSLGLSALAKLAYQSVDEHRNGKNANKDRYHP